ncbi:hypothetical protein ACOMHN_015804 [Nucella lapillus]
MTHVPNIFDLRVNPSMDSVMEERKLALRQAATWLLGRPSPVTELLAYVDQQHLLTPSDWTERSIYPDMEAFCTYMDQPLPGKVTLCPLNLVGALLHWKMLLPEYLPEVTLAIGLHPKKCARRSNTQDLHQLRTLLQSPHVKVVGEIGLDRRADDMRSRALFLDWVVFWGLGETASSGHGTVFPGLKTIDIS